MMRHEWDVEFVCSGRAALQALNVQAFDVIVTDMRMPEMDGFSLLTEVSSTHPSLLRVVLSGQSDMESRICSSGLVHSFLSKPCAVCDLTRTVRGLLEAKIVPLNA